MNIGLIVAILAIVLIFQGTKTTGPNPSFMKQVPAVEEIVKMPESNRKKAYELFSKLYQENPELPEELGRIPQFADNEISDGDAKGLERIVNFYGPNDEEIKQFFDYNLGIGLEDKRKYCVPLEALQDLAKEKELTKDLLLRKAKLFKDNRYLLYGVIIEAWGEMNEGKWKDFKEVSKRLNAPELIDFWMQQNLSRIRDRPSGQDWAQSASRTFRRKGGDCNDWVIFADYHLEKAGYDSYIISVMWGRGKGHSVAVYEEHSDIFVIGDTSVREIYGPFKSNQEVIDMLREKTERLEGSKISRVKISRWYNLKHHFGK